MIQWIRRCSTLVVMPLCILALTVGCQSTGRHSRVDPCSGCGSSHQAKQNDGHNHAHP